MLKQTIQEFWENEAQPALMDFVRLPAKSTAFDAQWRENGYLRQACDQAASWIKKIINGAHCEVLEIDGKAPCLFVEIEAFGSHSEKSVAFYGHLDKQPENYPWREGLGPWNPVVEGDYLYGRGASDDGYSVYAMITAIESLRRLNINHPRIVAIFETQEESGSDDLPFYLEKLKSRIGSPECFIILDNLCGDYEHLWLNTSLRGTLTGTLKVKALSYGVHSGTYSGIVPDPVSIAHALVARIHDPISGEVKLKALHTDIPSLRVEQLKEVSEVLDRQVWDTAPLLPGVQAKSSDPHECLLNSIWKPTLTIIGIDGVPSVQDAGSVIQGEVSLRLSSRTPPGIDIEEAQKAVREALTENIPYGCLVTWEDIECHKGWCAPHHGGSVEALFNDAADEVFGAKTLASGQGASIGFIPDFEAMFPQTEIILIGVLGPQSNAHSPNESLNIRYTQQLINTVSLVLSRI